MNRCLLSTVAGAMLHCVTAAAAADFSPEDSACQAPCAVQDARPLAEPASKKPRQPGDRQADVHKADRAPAVKVAANKPRTLDAREPALAYQRVAP